MKNHYEDYEPEFLNPKRNIMEANKYINSVINAPKVHPVAALNYVCKYCCNHATTTYPDETYCTNPKCPIGRLHNKMEDTRKSNRGHRDRPYTSNF